MRFISRHTSIPVPKVICAFTYRGRTYITMERVGGDLVGSGWLNRSVESQTKILSQLRKMIQEMRSLSPPQDQGITNVDGGPFSIAGCLAPHYNLGHLATSNDFHR